MGSNEGEAGKPVSLLSCPGMVAGNASIHLLEERAQCGGMGARDRIRSLPGTQVGLTHSRQTTSNAQFRDCETVAFF